LIRIIIIFFLAWFFISVDVNGFIPTNISSQYLLVVFAILYLAAKGFSIFIISLISFNLIDDYFLSTFKVV
jgi:hypothetical protein